MLDEITLDQITLDQITLDQITLDQITLDQITFGPVKSRNCDMPYTILTNYIGGSFEKQH